MRATLSAVLFLLAAAAPAPGLAQDTGQTAPTWTVQPADSRLGFVALQSGSEIEGRFADWSAEIAFDPASASGRVEVVVQTASVETGARDRDDSLRGDGLLHVEAYPQARFLAERFEKTGPESYEALGTLTLRDTTREVVLPFTLAVSDGQAEAEGALTVDRLDYGVGQGQWADTSMVGAEVRIVFEITATRR